MKKSAKAVAVSCAALALFVSSGCSSIMTGARKEVHFQSEPSGARVTITDEKGVSIFEGTTPTVVTLKPGKAYFVNKRYTVEYNKEGYEPSISSLHGRVSGWYAGNLIFGGLLGLIIIDPLTGAMYTLPSRHMGTLVPARVSSSSDVSLHVWQYQDVPEEMRSDLVRID